MIELEPNESRSCTIHAGKLWNSTGIKLVENNVYTLLPVEGAEWKDWFIPAGPDGFTRWYLNWAAGIKRIKDENWFALIGTYNKENPFLIGNGIPCLKALTTGELVCFANDIRGFYWNNKGSIDLIATRIT